MYWFSSVNGVCVCPAHLLCRLVHVPVIPLPTLAPMAGSVCVPTTHSYPHQGEQAAQPARIPVARAHAQ
jgi:hypothetical protein